MFTSSPFVRFERYQRNLGGGAWLLMGPGLFLTLMAVAILLWPELLAYLVAGVLLFAGLTLLTWGWTMRQVTRRRPQPTTYVEYRVS